MKTNKLLYGSFLSLAILLTGCSEDKGNYSYTKINEVTIGNIENLYTAELGSSFKIEPNIISLNETTADLSYSWTIENQEVSTEKVLDIVLPPLKYGTHLCALTITDNISKMQYRETFELVIVNPFNWGYYFLTRNDDGSTELAYIRAQKDVEPTKDDLKYTTGIGDYQFGDNPVSIYGNFAYNMDLGNFFWNLTFLSNEGQYPVIMTDISAFNPNSLINSNNFVDTEAGYEFKPEFTCVNKQKNQFFISEGKSIMYVQGKLYRPAQHNKEYYWSHPAIAGSGGTFQWVFDEISKEYYIIMPYSASESGPGIYPDANSYDKVIEPLAPQDPEKPGQQMSKKIEGNIIYSIDNYVPAKGGDILSVYTANNDGIRLYTLKKVWNGDAYFEGKVFLPFEGLSENPAFAVGTGIAANYFYICKDNDIYASAINTPKLEKWGSVPADKGKIEYIGFSARGSRMVVVTYDENSTEERKGTIYFIDVESKKVTHTFPNTVHHCVSYIGANDSDNENYGDFGDLK